MCYNNIVNERESVNMIFSIDERDYKTYSPINYDENYYFIDDVVPIFIKRLECLNSRSVLELNVCFYNFRHEEFEFYNIYEFTSKDYENLSNNQFEQYFNFNKIKNDIKKIIKENNY